MDKTHYTPEDDTHGTKEHTWTLTRSNARRVSCNDVKQMWNKVTSVWKDGHEQSVTLSRLKQNSIDITSSALWLQAAKAQIRNLSMFCAFIQPPLITDEQQTSLTAGRRRETNSSDLKNTSWVQAEMTMKQHVFFSHPSVHLMSTAA